MLCLFVAEADFVDRVPAVLEGDVVTIHIRGEEYLCRTVSITFKGSRILVINLDSRQSLGWKIGR